MNDAMERADLFLKNHQNTFQRAQEKNLKSFEKETEEKKTKIKKLKEIIEQKAYQFKFKKITDLLKAKKKSNSQITKNKNRKL